jgi:hypothetical protein
MIASRESAMNDDIPLSRELPVAALNERFPSRPL